MDKVRKNKQFQHNKYLNLIMRNAECVENTWFQELDLKRPNIKKT
jgi:hypothetical protein